MRNGMLVLIFVACSLAAVAQSSEQQAAEKYIRECESQWTEDTASGKTENAQRFIADDFVGIDTGGEFYDKAKELEGLPKDAKPFVSNHANEVKVRFFGDTAVAQGSESWVVKEADDTEKRERLVETDTWVKRNGKWQVVAAEDLVAKQEK